MELCSIKKTIYPEVMKKIDSAVPPFLEALKSFERGGNYNGDLLEKLYQNIIKQLIETSLNERTVYLAPELIMEKYRRGELTFPKGCRLVPDLFFFRVVTSGDYIPITNIELNIRFPKSEFIDKYNI